MLEGITLGAAPPNWQQAVVDLAKLPPIEYDQRRQAEAERLRCRVTTLDADVEKARAAAYGGSDTKLQGRALRLDPPERWPKPVDGVTLLNAIAAFLADHVFLPAGAAEALASWTLHTYCFDRFRHSPRAAFTSPEKRCGKTTALDALGLLVCKPLPTANVTAAALFRTIEAASPTLLIDEADTFLRDNEDLRGALNAGHKRGGQVVRCVGDEAEPRAFSVFGPAAIAAIGRLPGTIEDRALIVWMQRATRAERRAPLDAAAEAEGERLARMCARWTADHAARLAATDPVLPAALFNRTADNWRPLFAIAELAGGDWPARLAAASAILAPDDDDEGRGIRLLADIRTIFAPRTADQIASADLCTALIAIETSPWADMSRGHPITPVTLARLLRPFEVRPGTKRAGSETFKGYQRAAFTEPWQRYLPGPPGEGANNPSHRHNPQKSAVSAEREPSRAELGVTDREALQAAKSAACDGVTGQNPLPAEAGMIEYPL